MVMGDSDSDVIGIEEAVCRLLVLQIIDVAASELRQSPEGTSHDLCRLG